MPLLLAVAMVITAALRIALLLVVLEMREACRRRGKWAMRANDGALVAAGLLLANSAIGILSMHAAESMPPIDELAARVLLPLGTTWALLLVAIALAMEMRGRRNA
ncbi:MAG: hypothetical protein RIS45_788 [Planctomycetota bacterium]|jgi:hypothetical protein